MAKKNKDEYHVDTGASHHMVTDKSLFTSLLSPSDITIVSVGSGATLPAQYVGTLQLGPLLLINVLVVLGLMVSLISVSKTPTDYRWLFSPF